jgi:hypothetical protein
VCYISPSISAIIVTASPAYQETGGQSSTNGENQEHRNRDAPQLPARPCFVIERLMIAVLALEVITLHTA